MSDWTDSLQQASFRGVPFGVLAGQSRFGRRLALHEYPNRDKPWPEDMGRRARRFAVAGFLITDSMVYGGGDVIAQRESMVAAAEAAGSGDLVHPTFGRLSVNLESLDVSERWENGRYFELSFVFVEAGQRQFPSSTSATGDAVTSAASAASSAIGTDFSKALGAVLPKLSSLSGLSSVAGGFGANAVAAARDATSLFHLGAQLQGEFGRFLGGGTFTGGISGLIAEAAGLRSQVVTASAELSGMVGRLGLGGSSPSDVADSAAALASSVRGSAATPRDGLRLLSALASYGR